MTQRRLTDEERQAAQRLINAAIDEDLQGEGDLTTHALIPADSRAVMDIIVRDTGIICGLPVAQQVFETLDTSVDFKAVAGDCDRCDPGTVVAHVSGPLWSILAGERTALNFLTLLSGVASLTREFVDAVAGSSAEILDTRKTLPGYRLLQKYAVRCGGGSNHRMGLYDGILVKDNHIAACQNSNGTDALPKAIRLAKRFSGPRTQQIPVEVEVDSLEQLEQILPAGPDIVLLDNMDPDTLRRAVAIRDANAPAVLLEASGRITLAGVGAIAETGVNRISIGSLTHSAPALDIALDWPSV